MGTCTHTVYTHMKMNRSFFKTKGEKKAQCGEGRGGGALPAACLRLAHQRVGALTAGTASVQQMCGNVAKSIPLTRSFWLKDHFQDEKGWSIR